MYWACKQSAIFTLQNIRFVNKQNNTQKNTHFHISYTYAKRGCLNECHLVWYDTIMLYVCHIFLPLYFESIINLPSSFSKKSDLVFRINVCSNICAKNKNKQNNQRIYSCVLLNRPSLYFITVKSILFVQNGLWFAKL